jgi:imidazoleglycerol-phosphate dehydratase
MRIARVSRKTQETDILIELNLDGTGIYDINTKIGFFDHMLAQIAVHGVFDLVIKAEGDLQIDAHHTVEDCGLVLGKAFKQALGEKRGIVRIASALVPMDEALAQVVVDFSNRPYSEIHSSWTSPEVGGLPTSLLEHFFESYATASLMNLHMHVLAGRDNHHIAEALFKSFARATAMAVQIDPRIPDQISSTKGSLS